MVKKKVLPTRDAEWKWIQPVAGRPDIDGNISRMFSARGSVPPRSLKAIFPKFDDSAIRAAMFAREGIANSWDAYWASEHEHQDFELHFKFRTLSSTETKRLADALDLDSLRQHAIEAGTTKDEARSNVGLDSSDCLLDLFKPVRVLEVTERWGGGMGGAWDSGNSAMERALIKVGWAQTDEGAGGSFGFGKAAVAQASSIRSVLAYSCFPPEDDDHATRRLLGATYWNHHWVGDDEFNGWAVFGDQTHEATKPLQDSAADELAERLGLAVRSPGDPADQGTSLLIVDPSFDRAALEAAILCNWWPALQHTGEWRMHMYIAEEDEDPVEVVATEDHEVLGPFIRAFRDAESALEDPDRMDQHGDSLESDVVTSPIEDGESLVATAAIVEIPAQPSSGESLIALMRSHRMVIQYTNVGSGVPVARGVLVADDSVNATLRMTEPPEHDRWNDRRNSSGDNGKDEDYKLARNIAAQLKAIAAAFRKDRTPKGPDRRGWTPGFSTFLGVPGEAKDGKRPDPDPDPDKKVRPKRMVYVHLVHPDTFADIEQRPARSLGKSPNTLQAQATVEFAISDPDQNPQLDVEFQLSGRVVEESGKGDFLPIEVEPVKGSAGIVQVESGDEGTARFRGTLRKGKPVRFNVVTSEYSDEWTVDLTFDAVVKSNDGGI